MKDAAYITQEMNQRGSRNEPFVFLIDFSGNRAELFDVDDTSKILWQTPNQANFKPNLQNKPLTEWKLNPVSFQKYKKGFDRVQNHIRNGDSYLLNFTQPTKIKCNLSLQEIFAKSSAPYKILLRDEFVCFSPESFVRIRDQKISSYPMKGTIDAGIENATEIILNDQKEAAEHHTIVDLIRNDLSLVADNVRVEKFRYLERLKTNQRDLWQVSSIITGELPPDFLSHLGDIIFTLLPAGSVSGAPKKKTVEIIKKTEKYDRGYYTGIFGVFDGKNLDSCVLIRFIEKIGDSLVYKSGGGITFMSNAKNEYDEMLKKVYVPVD